ncbi:hypothetical protein [Chryseobacterium sp. JUb7]|uniref:hypothetical protein n=1 Tax=Chryseobacterium sp. JUb7 TaxID=2940599 RepID=UPI002169532F|nr:hypothetical protein [Chryseobacterium sp. JUb7]MCS3528688.1 hypothetical protein [Chryseobacterium sp. JUb7]
MKNIFYFLLYIIIISLNTICCKKEDCNEIVNKVSKTYDFNVLLVPDLSNRINPDIHPKPIHDTLLLNTVIDSIGNFLTVNNRRMNQLDSYKFDFINRGVLNNSQVADAKNLQINFREFKGKIRDASNFKRHHLKPAISIFKKNISKIYTYSLKNPAGSDVWNYLNQTITPSLINEPSITISNGKNSIIKNTKNVVVLFTDGYIESANNSAGYTFDQQSIKKIRQEFINSKSVDLEKFIQSKPEYLIKKTSNNLKNVNVLVLEMVDRSLDKNGSTTVQPTDFEIMKIIWTQWLKSSGAAHVEIYPAFSKRTDAYDAVKKFMIEISNN